MALKAIYPGSFDPPTLGHLDLIVRGGALFDELVVAVGQNPEKSPLLTVDERVRLIGGLVEAHGNIRVTSFEGLAVAAARREGCTVLLRGLRTVTDFESEYQMALTNRALASDLETVFVMPNEKYAYTSSRLVKEVFSMGGDASTFVPDGVAELVRERLGERRR